MFKDIEQGLGVYKKELADYAAYINDLNKRYGGFSFFGWDEKHYRRVLSWNATIVGMEKALGLDKEEITIFSAEAGIKNTDEESESEEPSVVSSI